MRVSESCTRLLYLSVPSDQVSGDGTLSKNEIKKMLQKDEALRQKLVVGSWKAFFRELDTDGGTPVAQLLLWHSCCYYGTAVAHLLLLWHSYYCLTHTLSHTGGLALSHSGCLALAQSCSRSVLLHLLVRWLRDP